MCWIAAPAKNLSGDIKSNDASAAVLIVPAHSHGTFDDQENIIGRVALADDHRIAAVADRTAPKREDPVFDGLLIAITQER